MLDKSCPKLVEYRRFSPDNYRLIEPHLPLT